MDTSISSPTPTSDAMATPATDPTFANGTAQPGGDANGQGAPADSGFTRVDPNTLPPQLRSTYDNLLRDYKEKTTKLSETVKSESAAFKQRAELYDQLSGQEEFVKQWNEYVQKVNAKQQESQAVQGLPPDIQQKLQKVDLIEQKMQQTEALEVINAFENALDDKGQKVHADFGKFAEIQIGTHPQAGEYSLLRAAVELAPGNTTQEKLANGYKIAQQAYSAIYEEGRKAGMGRLQARVLNGTQPPSNSGPGMTTTERRPKNAQEALDMARKGIAVSK